MDLLGVIIEQKVLLGIAFVTLLTIIIILILLEKKLSKYKVEIKQPIKEIDYRDEISIILKQAKTEKEVLIGLNKIAREVFEKRYGIPNSTDYYDMINILKEKEKNNAADFAKKMTEYSYSGEILDSYKISVLVSILRKILAEEREEINKESKFASWLNRLYKTKEKNQDREYIKSEEDSIQKIENIRNLTPITIKPMTIELERRKENKDQKKEEMNNLDNLSRISSRIEKKYNVN